MDDIFVCGTDTEELDAVEIVLKREFRTITSKEGDELSFLGMGITTHSNGDIEVKQAGYTQEIISEYEVTETSKLPHRGTMKRNQGADSEAVDTTEYKSLVMKLMYLAVRTRPDILYTVVALAMRSVSPTQYDMDCLVVILEYLNGTQQQGLMFRNGGAMNVNCYVDASFNCHDDGRGRTGYVVFPDNGVCRSAGVLFRSVKHKSVADSSTEAELMAVHEAVIHMVWIVSVYEELGYGRDKPATVYQDKHTTIRISSDKPVNFRGC